MNKEFLGLLAFYLVLLICIAPLLGRYIRRAMEDSHYRATAWGRGVERLLYRAGGIDPGREMNWRQYALAVLVFNVLGLVAVYALQRLQGMLPLNPAGMAAVSPDSAFNTAVSFVANTNWQGYGGESTMSYLTQMLALTVQNFLSAATGIAVVFALIRGIARHGAATIGNFWVDTVRSTLYILLPLSLALALALVSQGVIQNFSDYQEATTLQAQHYDAPRVDANGQPLLDGAGKALTDPAVATTQSLAMGPVASQEAIKQLGTNGGGFFNANSAHPFENPTPLSNLLQMLAILAIPAALCFSFGEMVGNRRQGLAIFAAMTLLFIAFALLTGGSEQGLTPALAQLPLDPALGNMEGKELRFGVNPSALFAVITTAASCGAVNSMHDSLSALGGLGPMLLMQLGEVVYGGVGAGLYGMLAFALLGVFIAGLMIGRTPEYLGKKIEAYDMKMVSIIILGTPFLVLVGTALAVSLPAGLAGLLNPGAHGFSEALYALSSAANNNGSAFAGLSANTPFYNLLLGIAMWFGRFLTIVAVLGLAGSLAAKKRLPDHPGAMPTTGPLFVVLLIGAVLLVGALTYVPALALGPVAEHLQAHL